MLQVLVWGLLTAARASHLGHGDFDANDVIERDVAIIGGGASGTYAAVRLREDHNGGHVDTYVDPETNVPVDYGVLAYLQYGHAADFFARFDIPIKPYASPPRQSLYVSTSNSSLLTAYNPPSFPEQVAAFSTWLDFTQRYANIMLPGLWDFPDGPDIPLEILLPFGEFARRHGIEATAPLFTSISNVGIGGIEDVLTLYVMFAMGEPMTREFLNASLFEPDGFSNSELYRRAYSLLSDDVLLGSKVSQAERSEGGVQLVVKRKGCNDRLVQAKKLLFTPPPSLKRLAPFGLDTRETQILGTWTPTWSFAAVAQIPDLPSNTSISWYAPDVGSAEYLSMRDWPWTLSLTAAAGVRAEEHLFEVLFATNYSISHAEARETIAAAVRKLCVGDALAAPASVVHGSCEVDFRAFVDHNSVMWRQTPRQLRENIVRDVYALQGRRSTWFTGGLWTADYTGNVWAFTETLLPRLLDSLQEG